MLAFDRMMLRRRNGSPASIRLSDVVMLSDIASRQIRSRSSVIGASSSIASVERSSRSCAAIPSGEKSVISSSWPETPIAVALMGSSVAYRSTNSEAIE